MTEFRFVYITTGDVDEARRIGRTLVEERLAACANVLDPMESFYWWEGKVKADREAVLIAKTRADLFPALVERVQALHSYSCPCIVGLSISDGSAPYLHWLAGETGRHS